MNFKRILKMKDENPKKEEGQTPQVPEGLLKKCRFCKEPILASEVRALHYTCPKCGGYFRMHALRRIDMITDEKSFIPLFTGLPLQNPLGLSEYPAQVAACQEKTHLEEAVVTGEAKINGQRAALGIMDTRFLMASMGEIVGEKITRLVEYAGKEGLPLILFTCSGGARMQEGMVSLMQMAKTSAALKRFHDAGGLYITVLTDPTTGGVTASFAMLGDIILAEPNALIGFAGPRVIEQTIGQKLPKGFQRSEFLLEHGFVDAIVSREQMKETLAKIIRLHQPGTLIKKEKEAYRKEHKLASQEPLGAWDRVLVSRKMERPVGDDYIHALFEDFIEFHGDRYAKDDPAVVGGIATFQGLPVTVIAQVKGHNTKENMQRNFGMPNPEGYRKALRLMKEAERFERPVILFVDTPGAFCGLEAEERGQGEAIARNLFEMSALTVPVLSILIGEGGSGGALAMAVANEVWMLENSVYSILSPEGYASILWKDSKRAKEAAGVMRMTASDLKEMGMIERIFPEPKELTVASYGPVVMRIAYQMQKFLLSMQGKSKDEIARERYERFRRM